MEMNVIKNTDASSSIRGRKLNDPWTVSFERKVYSINNSMELSASWKAAAETAEEIPEPFLHFA